MKRHGTIFMLVLLSATAALRADDDDGLLPPVRPPRTPATRPAHIADVVLTYRHGNGAATQPASPGNSRPDGPRINRSFVDHANDWARRVGGESDGPGASTSPGSGGTGTPGSETKPPDPRDGASAVLHIQLRGMMEKSGDTWIARARSRQIEWKTDEALPSDIRARLGAERNSLRDRLDRWETSLSAAQLDELKSKGELRVLVPQPFAELRMLATGPVHITLLPPQGFSTTVTGTASGARDEDRR